MSESPTTATDRERVVRALTRVARRLRLARVTRDLLRGFTLSLAVPIAVSVLYRFIDMHGAVVLALLGIGLLGFGAYAVRALTRPGTLGAAAASADRKAALHDELTTAYWFQRANESSDWIALQQHRAAGSADVLDVDRLYTWSMPRRVRTTVGLLCLLIVLNLLPLSWTRGWLQAGPPPVLALSQSEQMMLAEIERMLSEAAVAQGTELSQEMREALAELRQGQLTQEQAFAALEKLQAMLDGELDALLDSMAEALESTNATLAEALSDGDLQRVADQLRALVEQMTDAEREQLQAALREMAELAEDAGSDLAEDLTEAAEQLEQGNDAAAEAMEQLAQELEQLAQQQEGQEIRQAAAEGLEQLQQALGEESNELQSAEQGRPGESQADGMPQPGPADQDSMPVQAAESGAQSSQQGEGHLSASGAGDEIDYGAPTGLEVELLPEIMELSPDPNDEPGQQLIDHPSQAEESKLAYELVEPDLAYGEADMLDADTIPLSYRDLVKRYFQAVGPRGQYDH